MSDPIQPTGSQNPQNTAVENQSVGQFGNREVIDNNSACFQGLSEKVSSGFSLGRSIGRIWNAVKEGVIAFFRKLFGTKSKVPTGSAGVEMNTVSAKKVSSSIGSQPPSDITASSLQSDVPYKKSTVLPEPTVSPASAYKKEKKQGVSGSSSQPTSISSNSLNTLRSNASEVSNKTVPETSSTQSTASVKKDTALTAPKYELVDVPGNGNCGLYAVLVGTGALRASEFFPSPHADYGPHPLPNKEQEFFVQQLRSGAAEIAKKQLREEDGSYSEESLKTIGRLEQQHEYLETVDFQYIAQAIGRPIVVSQYQGNVETYRTICDPKETEPTSLFRDDFNNQQLLQENPIRLYFDGGHYQLMQPN